jgi:L-2-hydroxyglutarate oxidase LhgO
VIVTGRRTGVIGAGILGLAIASRLAEVDPSSEITVLEKEPGVGRHQTGHNSGVAHAGVYYPPGSLKATLCRRGITLLKAYCHQHGIAYDECGKLIIARDASELARLDEIERRATANGVPGLRRLGAGEIVAVEPHARGVSAVHSPSTAIVDFPGVAASLATGIAAAGGGLRLGFEVTAIARHRGETRVRASTGEELVFDRLIVCGGLQSDRLAVMVGESPTPSIIPFRGEYYRLVPDRRELVRGLIYPVPDPAYPFLGVHFTSRVDGNVDIGPNAVLALAREGYRRTDIRPRDIADVIRSPGFRRLARRHWRMGLQEMRGSLSRRAFLQEAQTFVPELTVDAVVPAPSGVRAQAVDEDGSLVDDFRITTRDDIVLVRNAPSPAATSSLAIAEYVVGGVESGSFEAVLGAGES